MNNTQPPSFRRRAEIRHLNLDPVLAVLASLPEAQRLALVNYYDRDFSAQRAAASGSMTLPAFRSLLMHTQRRVADALARQRGLHLVIARRHEDQALSPAIILEIERHLEQTRALRAQLESEIARR